MSKFVNSKENNNKLANIKPSTKKSAEFWGDFYKKIPKTKAKPKTNIFDILNENLFNIGNFLMTKDFKNLWESINFINTPYLEALKEFFVDKRKGKLDLSNSDIKDVRALSRLYKLNLSGCKNVTDVSALGGVHSLNLSYCNITDVRAIRRVKRLDLSYCHNIKDFSAFDASIPIKYLFEKIERIDKDFTDSPHSTDSVEGKICPICYEEFKKNDESGIRYIKLKCNHNFCEKCISEWSGTIPSSLRSNSCPLCRGSILPKLSVFLKTIIHKLILRGCNSVTNDSLHHLGKVNTLDLSECSNITDVSALGRVHTLYLRGCDNITDVSALGGVHTLDLSWCSEITDVSALGGVHTLNLSHCQNITDVSALGGPNQHTLDLRGCSSITDESLSALGNVPNLILQ